MVGPACGKIHFLALLMQCLENYWSEFDQTFSVDAFWDKDECASFWGHRSKVKVTAGGGIRSSTLLWEYLGIYTS